MACDGPDLKTAREQGETLGEELLEILKERLGYQRLPAPDARDSSGIQATLDRQRAKDSREFDAASRRFIEAVADLAELVEAQSF